MFLAAARAMPTLAAEFLAAARAMPTLAAEFHAAARAMPTLAAEFHAAARAMPTLAAEEIRKAPQPPLHSITVSVMGELRLYAIGIEEVRSMFGAPPQVAEHLRAVAQRAFAPPSMEGRGGLLSKLGPIFKRVPATPVISPTQPEPHDVEVLLAGGYVPPDRTGATWRLLETLVQGIAWGSTRMGMTEQELDDLDFALARGGVPASVGLRHLLNSTPSLNLIPVSGLKVGWHPHQKAVAMAAAYRSALADVESAEQRNMINSLAIWLDGFLPWAQVAASLGRPVPDLVGFWAS